MLFAKAAPALNFATFSTSRNFSPYGGREPVFANRGRKRAAFFGGRRTASPGLHRFWFTGLWTARTSLILKKIKRHNFN
jgi:hypothetical protein